MGIWTSAFCFATIALGIVPGSAPMAGAAVPSLAAKLEQHVRKVATTEHNVSVPHALEQSARYIEATLAEMGYKVERQEYAFDGIRVRNLEVAISNATAGKLADHVYIVGAHYDSAEGAPGANDNGSGTAALIELARMLKGVKPAAGTELKLVFFVNEEPPYFKTPGMGSMRHAKALREQGSKVEGALILETVGYYSQAKNSQQYPAGLGALYPSEGNFIAFVATTGSGSLMRKTLAAFRAASTFPAQGLVGPAFIPGVTFSDHWSYNQYDYPAIMITDTAFMRYPHYHTMQDTPDKLDYASMAQVVTGLSTVIRNMVTEAR